MSSPNRSQKVTPKEHREHLRAAAARALRGLLHVLDLDQVDLASALGVSETQAGRLASPKQTNTVTVADLRQLAESRDPDCRALARRLVLWATEPEREREQPENDLQLLGTVATLSQVAGQVAGDLDDGRLSPAEAHETMPRIAEARAALDQLEAACRAKTAPRAVRGG